MCLLPVNVAELVLTQATLQADGDIEGSAGRNSAANTRHGHHRDVLELDVGGRLRDEHETLVQEVKRALVGFDGTLDTVVSVMADKVLGRHDNLLTCQSTENLGHNLVDGLLVVRLELVLVLILQKVPATWLTRQFYGALVWCTNLLCHVQLQADLLVQLQLHHQEWISGLTLAKRRVETENNQSMGIIILRKQEELLDGRVLDLVVVCFATETEGRLVHIDIETTSARSLVSKTVPSRPRVRAQTWG